MRKGVFIVLLALLVAGSSGAQDSLLIQGVKYKTDTLVHTHDVGLGALHTYFRLPDLPLLVNTLVIDARHPFIRFESCLGRDSLIGLERPSAMALRNSRAGHQVFAAVNGDFYNTVSPNQGVPVNGQMILGQLAKVPHESRPVVAFDRQNQPFIDIMAFSGRVSGKGDTTVITGVNESRDSDELILFNPFFGRTTRTNQWGTEVICTLASGDWSANAPVLLKVSGKNTGVGSAVIPRDGVVLSGHGKQAAFLNAFLPGDTLTAVLRISLKGNPSLFPELTDMIGGDRQILNEGKVTDNNWVELHPRTAAGYSADGRKIILAVVDGRTDQSKGVSTKQLADIMKASGAAYALNLDGGGSSAMVVRNTIRNSPSDGSERAVGNALLLVSMATPGEERTMQLNARHITIPFGRKFQVKGSTFDDNGEVIRYLTAGNIHYAASPNIGRISEAGLFTASGSGSSGMITGSWNGMTDTMSVMVKPVERITFSVPSLLIDHRRDYVFKVLGSGGDGNRYFLDNDIIHFRSLDPAVGEVDSLGRFRGFREGSVQVVVSSDDEMHSDTCLVSVQIGRGRMLLDDFSDPSSWISSLSYIDQVTLKREKHPQSQEEMLRVDYSFLYSNRTASITLTKEIPVYGMPDSLMMEAAGSGTKNSYYYLLDHTAGLCQVPAFTGSSLVGRTSAIRSAEIPQEDYPLTMKSIRLIVERDPSFVTGTRYTGTFWLRGLYALYPEGDPQSRLVSPALMHGEGIFPNPAREGFYLRGGEGVQGNARVALFSMRGEPLREWEVTFVPGGRSPFLPLDSLPAGYYLYKVSGEGFHMKGKLIVVP